MKNNALFIQRLGAFLVDIIIIAFIASLISMPFINFDNVEKLKNEITNLSKSVINEDINYKTYINEYSSVYFQLEKQQAPYLISSIIIFILYFIVLQYYSGQTLGKKLFKIKLESTRKHLTINQMVVRGLLINYILLYLIEFAYIIFGTDRSYFYVVGTFAIIQYTLMIVSSIMIMFRKDRLGLHDLVCRTKVVRC